MTEDRADPPDAGPENSAPTGPFYRDPSHLGHRSERASRYREVLAAGTLLAVVMFVYWGRKTPEDPGVNAEPSSAVQGDSEAKTDGAASETLAGEATVGGPSEAVTPRVSEPVPPEPRVTPAEATNPATLPPILLPPGPKTSDPPESETTGKLSLADQAFIILDKHCADCHGRKLVVEGFSVLRHESLTAANKTYVTAGVPEKSKLWSRLGIEKDMPPEDCEPVSDADRQIVFDWIKSGAAGFRKESQRTPVSLREIWEVMEQDLLTQPANRIRNIRYISLAELHNNSFTQRLGRHKSNVGSDDIALAKAAVSKLLNSLSWEPRLTVPHEIGPNGVLLRINLHDYGWNADSHWLQLSGVYPYGMSFRSNPDPQMRQLFEMVTSRSGTILPVVRADWLVNNLSRAPLYDLFLGLPGNVHSLEKRLGVDVKANFDGDHILRAGFAGSGVSKHNRVVERHRAKWGSYWKSFDFGSSEGRGNIFKFPLGPTFSGNSFPDLAFEHDGGEIVFTLPNGLNGYFLAGRNGDRISVGPINVVRDLKETSGSPEVVNALSCIACHREGFIAFRDSVRDSRTVPFGAARLKVETIYAKTDVMDRALNGDRSKFLASLRSVTEPFIEFGAVGKQSSAVEPVFSLTRRYQNDLELDDVASELYFPDADKLKFAIDASRSLREIGLGPAAKGAAIKRSTWENNRGSFFKNVILELEIAEPLIPIK